MLYIEDSALVKASSLADVESGQAGAVAEGKTSWLDKTLAEVFSSLNVSLQVIFAFFVKMLWLAAFVYIVYCLVNVSAQAGTHFSQFVSEKWL